MTNKKRSSTEIGAAIGYFSNFFNSLMDELEKAGGKPEMLYFSSRDCAKPMMELVAKTIVESYRWNVPKSIILKEVVDEYATASQTFSESLDDRLNENWTWSSVANWLITESFTPLGAPDNYIGDPVPPELVAKMVSGEIRKAGDTITYKNKEMVVMYVAFFQEEDDGNLNHLCLAPAESIDLEN